MTDYLPLSWLDPPASDPNPSKDPFEDAAQDPALVADLAKFGRALAKARRQEKGLFRLFAPPGETHVQDVLAQIPDERRLRLFHWLTDPRLPHRRQIASALFDPHTGLSGAALATSLQKQKRETLIHRIFAPARVTALRNACLSLKEA